MLSSDEELRTRLEEVNQPPLGLLLDIDGTISPIAPSPAEALVPATTREQLQSLVRRLALVAALSGRSAEDASHLVGVDGMLFVGNHGLEIARSGRIEALPGVNVSAEDVRAVLDAARARLHLQGLIFEDKGLTASVHYRQTTDPDAARAEVEDVLARLVAERGLRLTPGRMVWEIRPPVVANKGTAARWIIAEHGLRSAIFCGDDRTDVDAFRALRELRDDGVCITLNVGVVAAETPQEVLETADLFVDGVAGVERLLEILASLT